MNSAVPAAVLMPEPALLQNAALPQGAATSAATTFNLLPGTAPGRAATEAFIADRFAETYGAQITRFFPLLLTRCDDDGLTAALGLRPGGRHRLFLEQYLDQPLDSALSTATGCAVDRAEVVEIGNLAAVGQARSRMLFILMTAVIAEAGFTWMTFTATRHIRVLLDRLGFEPRTVCAADPARLEDPRDDWGSYYESAPEVQVGSIPLAMEIMHRTPALQALLRQHEATIVRLGTILRALSLPEGV